MVGSPSDKMSNNAEVHPQNGMLGIPSNSGVGRVDNLIDSTKLMFHPERVAQWAKAKSWDEAKLVYPLYVEISPVGGCPHRCTFCGVMHVLEHNVTLAKIPQLDGIALRSAMYSMAEGGVKSIMFAGEGEPLLHKETNENVKSAKRRGLDVSFTTNGVLLHKLETIDLCSWVKVSVNAGTRETYAKVHKADDWDRVWKNIESAAKRKGKCQLSVQMVLIPENEHEDQELYYRAADAGVDLVILKPYSQARNEHGKQYSEHRQAVGSPIIERQGTALARREEAPTHDAHKYSVCHSTPNFWAYISSTGDVYTCSAYLMDMRFIIGNINDQFFSQIWEGEGRKRNWEMMKTHDISECRKGCRMNRSNEYLNSLAQGVPFVNFV
jgi:radical SAM protein with 4Fe4S-binding SPASM domain